MNYLRRMAMKQWIRRTLGLRDEPQINTDLNAVDDYVVVKKKDLDALVDELADLRSRNLSTDARELDLLLGNMEAENKALRALVDATNIASNSAGLRLRKTDAKT
jgi:hypothetical protein